MKKNQLIAMAALTSTVLVGCTIMKDLEYKVAPNPVEMHGDTITLNISGKFAEKGLHKKAVVEVTPYIEGAGGTKADFKTEIFQGEKAAGNGTVVPKGGKSFTYTSRVPYKADFEAADIKVRYNLKKGKKEKKVKGEQTPKIADATIITPYLVNFDDKCIMATYDLVRVWPKSQEVFTINYQKGQATVQGKELNDKDVKDFPKWMENTLKNPKMAIKGISASAYASPEGEIDMNANLAGDRAKSGVDVAKGLFKKMKYEAGTADAFYSMNPRGEDWDGFKTAMEKSTMTDKDLVIRVLTMTSDLNQREKEIRNMAKTYTEIERNILPQLRRTNMVLNYDLNGPTDDEIKAMSKATPDSLRLEELLYCADKLVSATDLSEKMRVYKEAARVYPTDWRAMNNIGCLHILQNNVTEAQTAFEKAAEIAGDNQIVKNNLGAIAHRMGDREKAIKLFNEAGSAGPEVGYNKGIYMIQRGKYSDAVSSFGSFKSFNTALAKFENGDAAGAKADLDASDEKESAKAHYLRAIMAARAGDASGLASLKTAISKDASLKAKAAKDREFIKWFENADFKAAVQ
jgi:Flp pilus assembly protein TadD